MTCSTTSIAMDTYHSPGQSIIHLKDILHGCHPSIPKPPEKNAPPPPNLNEVCPALAGEEGVNLLVQRRPVVGKGVADHAPARAPVAYRAGIQ